LLPWPFACGGETAGSCIRASRAKRIGAAEWALAYLWSVPLVAYVGAASGFKYDGGISWWLVAAYTWPIWLLTEIIRTSPLAVTIFYLIVLSIASAFLLTRAKHRGRA
jgi:hypothetical protein